MSDFCSNSRYFTFLCSNSKYRLLQKENCVWQDGLPIVTAISELQVRRAGDQDAGSSKAAGLIHDVDRVRTEGNHRSSWRRLASMNTYMT